MYAPCSILIYRWLSSAAAAETWNIKEGRAAIGLARWNINQNQSTVWLAPHLGFKEFLKSGPGGIRRRVDLRVTIVGAQFYRTAIPA